MLDHLADDPRTGLRWSACVADADTGRVVAAVHPERALSTASIGKLLLLLAVDAAMDAGTLTPDERVGRGTEHVADSGLWHLLDIPDLPIADACRLVGAVSDNLATNVLLDRIGTDAVAAEAACRGLTATALLDRVRDPRLPHHPPRLSTGAAGELAALAAEIDTRRPRVAGWLRAGCDLSMVAAAFGLDPLAHADADRGTRLWNKTGTDTTVRADVGVVRGGSGGLAYAVLAEWAGGADARDDVLAAMRRVGEALRGRQVLRPVNASIDE